MRKAKRVKKVSDHTVQGSLVRSLEPSLVMQIQAFVAGR
jgi:hypothetical protein